jgi:tetratricopeptide (TPR) repeat protein
MGKTELCEQFMRFAATRGRFLLAQGRCLEQFGTGEAYLPFLEVTRALLRGPDGERVAPALRQHAPTWFAQFAAFADREVSTEALREQVKNTSSSRMLREMGDALEALSALDPIVLLLEDMHWADPSSSDLLRLLGQRAHALRILVLATVRQSEIELRKHPLENVRRELLAHDQCEVLALPLLDRTALGRYIEARFAPNDFPADLTALIANTTEGHPLFATRLVQMLVERADIRSEAGRWTLARPAAELELAVPSSVRGLIQKKLESLDEPELRTLQYASVIGVEFSTSTLASLLELDEVSVDEQLDPLARSHHLLARLGEERLPSGELSLRYRFAHVLYQNVLYETLAGKRRMLLHQRAAESLSAEHGSDAWRVAAQLALHYEAARNYERAIYYLRHAADNVSRLHANREAKRHFAHALELVPELPPAAQAVQNVILRYDHGWSALKVSDYERAKLDFEEMLSLARSPEVAGDTPEAAQTLDAIFAYFAEPWRDAFGLLDTPRVPNQNRSTGAVSIQCEAYWALCTVLRQSRRLLEMGVIAGEYLALAEASQNEPRRVEALAWLATRELEAQNLERTRHYLEAGMPAARAIDHPRALYLFFDVSAQVHRLSSEYALAETTNEQALVLTFEAAGRVFSLLGIARARAHLGRTSAALSALAQALDIARRTELVDSMRNINFVFGCIHADLGDWESATRYLGDAADTARQQGLGHYERRYRLHLAHAHAAARDMASAERDFARAEQLGGATDASHASPATLTRRGHVQHLAARSEYLVERAEHAAAERSAVALLRDATELASPKHVALAQLCLARCALAQGRLDTARERARAGLVALEGRPIPIIGWKLHSAHGLAQRASDARLAADSFALALQLVGEIERGIDDDRLRAIWLRSPGVRELRAAAAERARAVV